MPASPASRPSPWSRVPLLVSCLGLLLALPVRPAAAKPQVIPVPYTLKDIKLPHPAYNGHPTTFKAIARPIGAEACETPLYRWDINGNGLWADEDPGDDCADKAEGAGGWIQADTRYNLECRAQLPEQNRELVKKKLFVATVEVKCSTNADSAYGNYYVMVFAEVPKGRATRGSEPDTYAYTARPYLDSAGAPIPATCSNSKCAVTNFPCSANWQCEGDNDESLRIKRDVALDDAMWYLHKQVSGRSGHGSPTYTGYTHAGSNSYMTSYGWNVHKNASAVHLWVLSQNGHIPAYPGYVDGAEPMSAAWKTANLYRYDNDPYAEDAGRLFNFIVSSHAASGSWPASNWTIDNSVSAAPTSPRGTTARRPSTAPTTARPTGSTTTTSRARCSARSPPRAWAAPPARPGSARASRWSGWCSRWWTGSATTRPAAPATMAAGAMAPGAATPSAPSPSGRPSASRPRTRP